MKRHYETDRLILAVLDEKKADVVLDFYLENEKFLEPFEHIKPNGFYTLQNHQLTLRLEEESFLKGELIRLWLFKKNDTYLSKPIGTVALTNIIRGAFKSCYLGYKMSEAETNKGYMTEAIDKIVNIAFKELRLHRIEANIMPSNLSSIRVVEKCGFINEGLARKYLKINGKWEDHYHFVILNNDDV